MIIFKQLIWSNAFSYGPDNVINLDESPLTQLIGKNGHGKTSIALILEEVLYNKNSKGIKKADVLNRHVKDKAYTISVTFDKDGTNYEVVTKRGSTQTVSLFQDGEDISSHTSTATYKQIENVLGMDHKTFSQIVCQFGADSLQFLVDTDTNRKKFLVELFKLSKYVEIGESFKALAKEVETEVTKAKSALDTANRFILGINEKDLQEKELIEYNESSTSLKEQISSLRSQLSTLESENKRRINNNQYKKLLDSIILPTSLEAPEGNITEWNEEVIVAKSKIQEAEKHLVELGQVGKPCRLCGTVLPHDSVDSIIAAEQQKISELKQRIIVVARQINEYNSKHIVYTKGLEAQRNFENYHSLYDPKLPSELLDKETINSSIAELTTKANAIDKKILEVAEHNKKVTQHNAKVEVLKSQLQEFKAQANSSQKVLVKHTKRATNLGVLIKTFSTTGLIAYKLECLVKDLEDQTNEYLNDLSAGRFQLSFKINTSDKLNVIITDKGVDVDIAALSTGERARVNVATLLGIRKLLQSISSTRVNLLFLDETIENLDSEGKEKLIEVLLKEEHLNTVLVSHGFNHPLLSKVHVIKNKNISSIEHG